MQSCLGGRLIVGDEHDGAFVSSGGGGQDQVDAGPGHRLAQVGQLSRLVIQVDSEHAHLLSPLPQQSTLSLETISPGFTEITADPTLLRRCHGRYT
jgi:hypothetical protein